MKYKIHSDGTVESLDSYIEQKSNGGGTHKQFHKGKVLVPQLNSKGYLRVHYNGKYELVHRLVAKEHVSNPDNKPQVNHIDGDKLNNNASNLEWVTNQENRTHAIKNSLTNNAKGEEIATKLTAEDVKYIRSSSERNVDLADKFNVSPQYIGQIKLGKRWKHLL